MLIRNDKTHVWLGAPTPDKHLQSPIKINVACYLEAEAI